MWEITILGCISLWIGFWGFSRSFKHKNLVIFIWVIVLYYIVASIVSMTEPDNMYVPKVTKLKFMSNLLFCTLAFYLSDVVFNKTTHAQIVLDSFIKNKFFTYFEIAYWASYILMFLQLRTQDYTTYNTGNGAGWAQVIFIFTSGIIYLFVFKKQWIKIIVSAIMMVLIIVVIGVRSMLYFVLMPIVFYFLYYMLYHVSNIKQFMKKCVPFAFIIFIASYVVSVIRFGSYSMPETELTSIALNCFDKWNFGYQYANSILHYFIGFLAPIKNALNMIDITLPDYMQFIPSVPHLNAMIYAGVSDMSNLENAYHMPATIFFDFMVSWGVYAPIVAFFVYWYFIKIFNAFQKSALRMILFSSIIGWHFYMLMRGSIDTCASAMAYPLLLGIIVYFVIRKFKLIQEECKER